MNRDTILKYISGLMNRDEVMDFEQRLKSDSELSGEYEELKTKLDKFSSYKEIDDDTAYFNNLLPIIRTKIDSRKSKNISRFAPALSLVLALLIIFFIQFPENPDIPLSDSIFSEQDLTTILSETDDSTLTNYLDVGYVINSNYLISENETNFASIYIDQTILDELGLESSSDYNGYDYYEDVTDYSEEEATIIYNELIDKKIL